jgi:hypothetical protein
MKKRMPRVVLTCCLALMTTMPPLVLAAAGDEEARLEALEQRLEGLVLELDKKQSRIETLTGQMRSLEERMPAASPARGAEALIPSEEAELNAQVAAAVAEQQEARPLSPFSVGGYGEIHANFTEGSEDGQSKDQVDIHRLVAFVGYDFADWIKFQAEIELEHAFVYDGAKGELELEQAYVDFLLTDLANIRVGRVLTPLARINQHHEPTTFYSVERPNFAKHIIPSTWWSDGLGLFGNLAANLTYEAYLVAGMDGSKFSDKGIRSGRIKDVPSVNDMAVTFRVDYHPLLMSSAGLGRNLRLGASFYHGGINNGVAGKDPGISGDYVEAGYHVMPAPWKAGRLKNADAVLFVRYDEQDTQHKMSSGVAANADMDRYDWTFGLAFYPVPNLVLKADYQVLASAGADPADSINLGIGWQF